MFKYIIQWHSESIVNMIICWRIEIQLIFVFDLILCKFNELIYSLFFLNSFGILHIRIISPVNR